jgi:hypothetical protein
MADSTSGRAAKSRDAADVLSKTREILGTARQGLHDLLGDDPTRRATGIRNVAVFGRSVTFVLQTLRSVDREAFNRWYEPRAQVMKDDPLCAYFTNLRNEILKEGGPSASSRLFIERITSEDIAALMASPPPGAKSFFIGDSLGGSGWEVELPDGSVEKFYVQLPKSLQIEFSLHFPDPPIEHLGQPIADTSLENLGRLYIDYLSSLVSEAEEEFGGKSV